MTFQSHHSATHNSTHIHTHTHTHTHTEQAWRKDGARGIETDATLVSDKNRRCSQAKSPRAGNYADVGQRMIDPCPICHLERQAVKIIGDDLTLTRATRSL